MFQNVFSGVNVYQQLVKDFGVSLVNYDGLVFYKIQLGVFRYVLRKELYFDFFLYKLNIYQYLQVIIILFYGIYVFVLMFYLFLFIEKK